jgi:hypothetical protein
MVGSAIQEREAAARVHLVGSVPVPSAEDALRVAGPIVGDRVAALPDGEPAERSAWVHFLAYRTFYPSLAFRTVQRPAPREGHASWYARGIEEEWTFEVIDRSAEVEFPYLGYAAAARDSYRLLQRLRAEGVVPPGVGLQVAIPFPDGAVQPFFRDPRDYALVAAAYRRAAVREIQELVTFIPPHELRLQWDVCWEVLNLEGVTPWVPDSDHWARYTDAVAELSQAIPASVAVGYHLCYGNWEARHMVEPSDLALCVRMANAAAEHAQHEVAFIHMPVPIDRDDDVYFAPLRDLDTGSARIYLGLVHAADGLDGAARRVAAARGALPDFGVATECGMGYVPEAELESVLRLHRDIADRLLGAA